MQTGGGIFYIYVGLAGIFIHILYSNMHKKPAYCNNVKKAGGFRNFFVKIVCLGLTQGFHFGIIYTQSNSSLN